MGYAQKYHVEGHMREDFVTRIAPVSRISNEHYHLPDGEVLAGGLKEMIMNYIGEKVHGLSKSY